MLSGKGGPWGGSWDDLRFFNGLTKGAMDWTGCLNAVPNNHWGRFFIDCESMVGPVFNAVKGYNWVIDTIEFIKADLSPQLMKFQNATNVQIGALKIEGGTSTTSGLNIFEFLTDASGRIGELMCGGMGLEVDIEGEIEVGEDPEVDVDVGTFITLLKSGSGGAGTATQGSRIIIDRINAATDSLTGAAYAVSTASPHTIEIGSLNLAGGWELQNSASTTTGDRVTVRSWLNHQLTADRGDADYTIATTDSNINRFATAFTAQRTITLPGDDNLFNGLYYEFIFDGAINGANTAVIKVGATTLATITTDKTVVRYTWRRQGNPANGWVMTRMTSGPIRVRWHESQTSRFSPPAGHGPSRTVFRQFRPLWSGPAVVAVRDGVVLPELFALPVPAGPAGQSPSGRCRLRC